MTRVLDEFLALPLPVQLFGGLGFLMLCAGMGWAWADTVKFRRELRERRRRYP